MTLPTELQVALEGETYYKYGVMMKKVANFYNNMALQVRGTAKGFQGFEGELGGTLGCGGTRRRRRRGGGDGVM